MEDIKQRWRGRASRTVSDGHNQRLFENGDLVN